MTNKPWSKMSPNEKLDWLREQISEMNEAIKKVANAQRSLMAQVNHVLSVLEAKIKKIATAVSDLQKRGDDD